MRSRRAPLTSTASLVLGMVLAGSLLCLALPLRPARAAPRPTPGRPALTPLATLSGPALTEHAPGGPTPPVRLATGQPSPTHSHAAPTPSPTARRSAGPLAPSAGAVVINEVVTDPQLDWSSGNFDGVPGAGSVSEADEFVELYVKTAGLDLAGWTIELQDASPTSGDLSSAGAFQVSRYAGTGSFGHTAVGDYLLLGNPRGGSLADNLLIRLKDAQGNVVDQVQIGDGGAPSGNATGPEDESISRVPNGVDTDDDAGNFLQQAATPGRANQPGAPAPTATPGTYPLGAIVINEVAWAGTLAAANDEWIELHNPGGAPINLQGWTLTDGSDLALTFPALTLPAGGYLLLERTSDLTVADIPADLIYTGSLNDAGESLALRDAHGNLIDTANGDGGGWSAGGGPEAASMERLGPGQDTDGNWQANTGLSRVGHDAAGNLLRGTARAANSAAPSPTPTTVAPAVGSVLLNEFLPRPAAGGQEFIELINVSAAAVDLSGWMLDDAPGGTGPFTVPAGTSLAPGALLVFDAALTGLALNNDGDSVRLLRPDGSTLDEWTYTTSVDGVSWARLPDGGSWSDQGDPTPGAPNRALPGPSEPGTVPIGQLRGWPDGAWATVSARVSVPPGLFSPRTIHLQDATGGITVYLGRDDWPPLAVGQSVRVLGYLRHRSGDLQLYLRNAWHIAAGPAADLAPPAPRGVGSGLVGEATEGALVTVTGRVVRLEANAFWLDDGSGPARVFFPVATGLARPLVRVGETWRVTGAVVEFTTADSLAPNYRLQPRFASDVEQWVDGAFRPAPLEESSTPLATEPPEPTATAEP